MGSANSHLSPQKREVLLDAIRPPAGFELDCAVGTTFSVNLQSALLVPLAFALFDTENGDVDKDPVSVLAATRTYANRVSLYCQEGHIAAGVSQPSVLAYLEETLRPVRPPRNGTFHPKLWVLRYRPAAGGNLLHRVLCLSRNLTFDHSWDTIVRLEQAPHDTPTTGQTTPLIEFLRYLGKRAKSGHVDQLVESLSSVTFEPPPRFQEAVFHPSLGSDGRRADPLADGGDSLLVVSPFLADGRLIELLEGWQQVRVASRPESLDRIAPAVLGRLAAVFQFDSPDERPQDDSQPVAVGEEVAEASGLAGLHAKVSVGERDRRSFVFAGSANATNAAFSRNVEFGVELRCPTRGAGPSALLRGGNDPSEFRTLLREYAILDEATEPSAEEQELERLEDLRRQLASIRLTADLKAQDTEGYSLRLSTSDALPALDHGDRLTCWPITLGRGSELAAQTHKQVLADFEFSALSNATGLICFRLASRMAGVPDVTFTLLAKLTGDIEGRLDAVMGDILTGSNVMRFLLLLLAAGGEHGLPAGFGIGGGGGGGPNGGGWNHQLPLLETLLRTFSRDRGRLHAFNDALHSLRRLSEHGADVPEGLLDIWAPIEEALKEPGRDKS